MAYEAPTTMVTGTVVTAGIWNQGVVDNTIFLHAPPGARVTNSQDVSIASGVVTALSWDTEEFDKGDCFDAGGQTDRLVAPIDGIYYMYGSIFWQAVNTLGKAIMFHSNGERLFHDTTHPEAGADQAHCTAGMWLMNAGEYVRLYVYHETGANRLILADGSFSLPQTFGMHWIGSGEDT